MALKTTNKSRTAASIKTVKPTTNIKLAVDQPVTVNYRVWVSSIVILFVLLLI